MKDEADLNLQAEHAASRSDAVSAHPIAELLECPPETSSLLNADAVFLNFQAGDIVFRQDEQCRGLYVVIAGECLRKTDRLSTRVTLGPARPGDIVELASALSAAKHTYSLTALSQGTLLFLPLKALYAAFEAYPPLRMRLLQELAREVSRAYHTCCMSRSVPRRRRNGNGFNHASQL